MDDPLKHVEGANERIGEEKVIVDELSIGTTSAFGDTPAETLGGTGKDLGATGGVLETDLIRVFPFRQPLMGLTWAMLA